MRVKALQSMYYNRSMKAVGEEYDMDDREEGEAKILSAIGKIEILRQQTSKPDEPIPAPKYTAAALEPEPQPETTTEDQPQERRRYYRRRDMRAEE